VSVSSKHISKLFNVQKHFLLLVYFTLIYLVMKGYDTRMEMEINGGWSRNIRKWDFPYYLEYVDENKF